MSDGLDQFFTPQMTALSCWAWLLAQPGVETSTRFYIEPSAGRGAFMRLLPRGRRSGYEIDRKLVDEAFYNEDMPLIWRRDYLELHPSAHTPPDFVAVGNPPFGHRGATAVQFINHSFALGAAYVAFILPPAFKPHADGEPPVIEKRLLGHSIASMDVPDAFELPAGEKGNKDIAGCAFVLYKRGSRARGPLFEERKEFDIDEYIECHTINQADWRVKEGKTYGGEWIGKCDLYLPCSSFGDHCRAHDEFCQKEMVGVIIKRDRNRLFPLMKRLDWPSLAKKSVGERLGITPTIIKQVVERELGEINIDDYISLYIVREGSNEGQECDVFLPRRYYKGQQPKPSATRDHDDMIGVVIHRDRERIKSWMLAHDWSGKPQSVNGSVNLNYDYVKKELAAELTKPPYTLYNIGEANKKAGYCAWGKDKETRCARFLPVARRHGQPIKASATNDYTSVIGIETSDPELLAVIDGLDWSLVARQSTNRNLCLSQKMVKAALEAGGTIIKRGAVSGCDFYVRGDLGRPEVRDGTFASVEPLPAKWSPVGVKLGPADRPKLRWLLSLNWKPYIRKTPTNFGHLTIASVKEAIASAKPPIGFGGMCAKITGKRNSTTEKQS